MPSTVSRPGRFLIATHRHVREYGERRGADLAEAFDSLDSIASSDPAYDLATVTAEIKAQRAAQRAARGRASWSPVPCSRAISSNSATPAPSCSTPHPEGVIDVAAGIDLDELNTRITANVLRHYGTFMRLLAEIDDVVVVFDGHGCHMYSYGGGVAFDCLMYAQIDFLDLDNLVLLKGFASRLPETSMGSTMEFNPAIKAQVMDYMAGGVPYTMMTRRLPTYLVEGPAADWLYRRSHAHPGSASEPRSLPTSPTVVRTSVQPPATPITSPSSTATPGALHVSEPLGRLLLERAPSVAEHVRTVSLPKWIEQRRKPRIEARGDAARLAGVHYNSSSGVRAPRETSSRRVNAAHCDFPRCCML